MSERPVRLRLDVLGAEGLSAELPEKGLLVVGCSSERSGLVLQGQGVEDAHCAIGRVKSGGWAIKDLGTRYGTFLNGERIVSTRLAAGDLIVVGSRRLAVVDASAPPSAAPAPAAGPAAVTPVPGAAPEALPAARPADVPERLGGYRIQKLLGRGGMGLVYLAIQESLNRPVALKVVSSSLEADREFVRRFQSEARAAAALNHPNVVVVHDVGEAEGHHYLSMEFMAAGSLEERVARHGPIPWREVLDILFDAARGLTYAEERGIVHRDIKPANLMSDGAGTAKIADLGLATGIEAEDDERGRRIYGTPHFISPEQARGEPVDGRSDLYSLGATAYRLLSGRTPFEGETTRDILRQHFTEKPAPLEHVPTKLNELIQRLLAKAPAERYQRAEELVQALDRRRERPPRRRSKLVPLALVAALLSALGYWRFAGSGGSRADEGARGPAVAPAPPSPEDGAEFFRRDPLPPGAATDEEHELKVLELEAELAYSKIPADLGLEERIEELRAVAAQYGVTTVASRARAEARDLELEAGRQRDEAARREVAVAGVRGTLTRLAAWPPPPGELPRPGEALRQINAFQAPAELAGSAELAATRRELQDEIVRMSRERLAAELDEVLALAQAGSFEGVQRRLGELLPRFDLPEYAAGEEPEGWGPLLELRTRARGLRDGLVADQQAWNAAREHADRALLAAQIGPGSAFSAELRALDLAALEARLAALSSQLQTDAARGFVDGLREEASYGRAALTALIEGFERGEWRRKTVVDPRGRRNANREAVGAAPDGIRVDADGVLELVPWSAFDRGGLEQLFKGRLIRGYTADEIRGITFLLAGAATLEAAERARAELDDRRAVFEQDEVDAMVAGYSTALSWATGVAGEGPSAPEPARLFVEREHAAAELLARALSAVEAQSWTGAVAALEELFAEHGDGLLVTLLSDGTEWRLPPEDPAVDPASPAEPAPADPAPTDDDQGQGTTNGD